MRLYTSDGKRIGDSFVKSVNHRGYGEAPENTLPAYKMSWEKGFDYVECDVALTSDGVPVLLHDDTINRTARNADGTELSEDINIADITYEEATAYDYGVWKSSEYAGTTIPTFSEFIRLCRDLRLHPYIEIKYSATFTDDQIANLINIVTAHGMRRNVTWISFSSAYLLKVLEYDPTARIGWVLWSATTANIDTLVGWENGKNEVFADVHYPSVTDEVLSYAVSNNVPVECWSVTTEDQVVGADPAIAGFTCDTIHAGQLIFNTTIG